MSGRVQPSRCGPKVQADDSDYGRTMESVDLVEGPYGAHWWASKATHSARFAFRASGFGLRASGFTICPALNHVIVRLGKTPAAHKQDLNVWQAAMVDTFGASSPRPR